MPSHVLVLSDCESGAWLRDEESQLNAASSGLRLGGADSWSIARRTLRGGPSNGVEVVDLCNGPLTVAVLPTRGMGIWYADYRGLRAGWESPVRFPVHPRHVHLTSRNGLGWLDGFNELLCRCGLASNGPPGIDADAKSPVESQLTLHGKIANLPAHRVEIAVDDADLGTLSVTGVVDECTLFGPQLRLTSTIRTVAGSHALTIVDEVQNLGAAAAEFQLLYHTNIGRPFLDEGARFLSPYRRMAPRDDRAAAGLDEFDTCLGPTLGYAEQVYFFDPIADASGETPALLRNRAGDCGLSVHFRPEQLPCFSLWKCTQHEADGYVTGLEPATNFPNFKADERRHGRVIDLPPGTTYRSELRLEIHDSAPAVTAVEARIQALQATHD